MSFNKSIKRIGLYLQILDNVTLINLDVIPSGPDATSEGTLLDRLDHCSTAFGINCSITFHTST